MRSLVCLALAALAAGAGAADPPPTSRGLTLVVMDPLAAPLSCPCVKGYAQRDYDQLAAFLTAKLGRPVTVAYAESLRVALEKKTQGQADLVIGKRSVVLHDAQAARRDLAMVADLTGKDGATTMTGLIVVPSADPAKTAADLKGYRIIFGSPECDEKYAAAMTLLKGQGVTPPAEVETTASCSDGCTTILEAGPAVRGAAVISSYAKPLLEGCGTVKKGDLRVVGETAPVPFITAFVNAQLPASDREAITEALLAAGRDPKLAVALETKVGFVPAVKKN